MEHFYRVECKMRGCSYFEGEGFDECEYDKAFMYFDNLCDSNDVKDAKFIDVVETDIDEPYEADKNAKIYYELNLPSRYDIFKTKEDALKAYDKAIERNPKLQSTLKRPVKVYETIIKEK
ncbi:MAG: hypothetical protein [Wendovervirus sonii]|uniref:Tetratricopeptide repeat protein n=1 Tax=phage Lak_Megaphage_Sonny TaxID=3109229 RepID=A0ABZ0Z5G9_9CAUD|nr:MAG: hypothetical protein [phage Lak_Megaphage_Sonny]